MMLEIKELKKKFGKFHALNGLDFVIPKGSLYGFVGPNGQGKTTAIKIMTGLLFADSGQVLIEGRDVSEGLNQLKEKIGYVQTFLGYMII